MVLQTTKKSKKGHYGRKGRTIYIHMGIWHNKKTGHIHIAGPKEVKLHSTVSDDSNSKRYHPTLYKKLQEILKKHKRWP